MECLQNPVPNSKVEWETKRIGPLKTKLIPHVQLGLVILLRRILLKPNHLKRHYPFRSGNEMTTVWASTSVGGYRIGGPVCFYNKRSARCGWRKYQR